MAPSIAELIKHYEYDPTTVDRVAQRRIQSPITIVPYCSSWPTLYETLATAITNALPPSAFHSIQHAGSTSVPNLPAKPIIDIDLVVNSVSDEASYIPALEGLGYHFLLREPRWHEHRFLCMYEPSVNLHVFGVDDLVEVERHRIMRDWLRKSSEDRERYAEIKREAALVSTEKGESMMDYTQRKDGVIREILGRAFRDLGYIKDDEEDTKEKEAKPDM